MTGDSQIRIFSFFAGSGFLDLGFEHAGFDVCYANELHQPFLDAYRHSRKVLRLPSPRHGFDNTSIDRIDSGRLKELVSKPHTTGFIGGPPCPDFSVAGKNRGRHGDNGKLSETYVDLVCTHKPGFFLFENVKGLYRTHRHREFFEMLKGKLRRNGYQIHERLVNAIEYGVPQDRERIILVGFLDNSLPDTFEWKGRKYDSQSVFNQPWPTVDEFEWSGPRPAPEGITTELTAQYWFDKNGVDEHPNATHCFRPRSGLRRFHTVGEGDVGRKSYKRLHRWRYSPTVAYGNNEVHLHPYLPRRLTVAEALALQSLPKKFELPADMTLTDMFKTIGNGVPYPMALGLARSIRTHLGG